MKKPYPSPNLSPEVVESLTAAYDLEHDKLLALVKAHQDRELSHAEQLEQLHVIFRIACLSNTLHHGSFGDFLSTPADRLLSVVQIWLWEFEEPESWPTRLDVAKAQQIILTRPDADTPQTQAVIAECKNYLSNWDAAPKFLS